MSGRVAMRVSEQATEIVPAKDFRHELLVGLLCVLCACRSEVVVVWPSKGSLDEDKAHGQELAHHTLPG